MNRQLWIARPHPELISFAHNVCRLLAGGYGMNALVGSGELHEA